MMPALRGTRVGVRPRVSFSFFKVVIVKPNGRPGYSALYKEHDVVEVVGILRIKHQRQNSYT
jgi:hypothetical protein